MARQSSWLKDEYGLSWQIIPRTLITLINDKDPVKAQRVMQAMLNMWKIDIDKLRNAYEEKILMRYSINGHGGMQEVADNSATLTQDPSNGYALSYW